MTFVLRGIGALIGVFLLGAGMHGFLDPVFGSWLELLGDINAVVIGGILIHYGLTGTSVLGLAKRKTENE